MRWRRKWQWFADGSLGRRKIEHGARRFRPLGERDADNDFGPVPGPTVDAKFRGDLARPLPHAEEAEATARALQLLLGIESGAVVADAQDDGVRFEIHFDVDRFR